MGQSIFLLSDFDLDSTQNQLIGIRSEALSNSTALSAKATNAGLFGGYISEEERNFMIGRSALSNVTGNYWNTSVFYAKRLSSETFKNPVSFFVQFTNRQEANATFSQNALKLALFGNKQFAGETVVFTPLQGLQFHYNQLQFGIHKTYSNDMKFGVGASFIYGQTNRTITVPQMAIYTSEIGDEITGAAQILLQQSDPNNAQTFAYNGAGASVDLSVEIPIQITSDSSRPAQFTASIHDLGFVNWNTKSEEFVVDSNFVYTGTDISNVFDPAGNIINGDPVDFFDSISTNTQKAYTSVLPLTILVQLNQRFEKSEVSLAFSLRNNANYAAFFQFSYAYFLSNSFSVGANVNYGGFGKFGGGLMAKYDAPKFIVKLGSTNIEGFLNPSKWAGQSVYVLLGFKFGK